MTILKAMIAAGAVAVTSIAPAFADGHAEFDVENARLDMMLDTNGDGEVTDSEIIDGNVAVFDLNGDGVIDAEERGEAEAMLEND